MKLDPQEIADEAIYAAVRQAQGDGRLPLETWTNRAMPLTRLGLDSFMSMLERAPSQMAASRGAPGPAFPGAVDHTAGYRDTLQTLLKNEEGLEHRAYHGALSSHRKGQKDHYVRPGHGSKEEVSIGYGFNLQRQDARAVFKNVLGLDDAGFDEVFNGTRMIDDRQAAALRDYVIDELDAWLTRETGSFPLRDHQRAALLSLAYNAGPGRLKQSGILDAVKRGADEEAYNRILSFATANGKLASRRKKEAILFAGADAEKFYAKK